MEKEYEIGGKKIVLKSLTVREGSKYLFDLADEGKRNEAIEAIIDKTLEKSGLSDLMNSPEFVLGDLSKLATAVLELNGLSKDAE